MEYTLKISSEAGDIEIGNKYVKDVEYFYDTQDNNALDKSSNVGVTLKVSGDFNADCKDMTEKIAKWAFDTEKAKVYRECKITIEDQKDIVREYILPDAFVLDYKEYNNVEGGEVKDSRSWTLLVAQKGDRIENVKIKS
jgi:hypothetical protein